MKVSVYKEEGGAFSVLVQASPGKGRPPVLVVGVTAEEAKAEAVLLVDAMRGPRPPKPQTPGAMVGVTGASTR